ncbi:hypothetical protein AAFF_G00134640 [Aldrovandia affinis]|uniref:Uncharacterized protein n=1 Tax=Aldrovandia affinis TaxID=143900 RepID=A0AAD7RQE1_9TELE|nr:hypothetical protein AAFF_G00134640 [Aldrovandia affinis]
MQALSFQKREAHNRSPISFREGRRASDTSLTQGLVAFRQHLQNLARTKGILELNKVQLLYEQIGPEEDPCLGPTGPHPYLQDPQLQGDGSQQQDSVAMFSSGGHPPLLSRRQSLETQYLTHRLQKASLMAAGPGSCQMFCKDTPRSLEQQLQEHRLHQKRLYLQKQSQLQAYFNQMQIAEGAYPTHAAVSHPDPVAPPAAQGLVPPAQQQGGPQTPPAFTRAQALSPLLEPGAEPLPLPYDPYMSLYPTALPPSLPALTSEHHYSYPACDLVPSPPADPLYQDQYQYPLDPVQPPPQGQAEVSGAGYLALPDLHGPFLDCEMMDTVDSQHGFVLVN